MCFLLRWRFLPFLLILLLILLQKTFPLFYVLFCYFYKHLVIVYLMMWKFFNDLNVVVKESNTIFPPLQSTNTENRVHIRLMLNSSQPVSLKISFMAGTNIPPASNRRWPKKNCKRGDPQHFSLIRGDLRIFFPGGRGCWNTFWWGLYPLCMSSRLKLRFLFIKWQFFKALQRWMS